MAERLAGGNVALALLCNAIATGAALTVLILTFGPLSGAHFNPWVSAFAAIRGDLAAREAGLYAAAQVVGAVVGVVFANLMFDLPAVQISATLRDGGGRLLGEVVATLGLLVLIFGGGQRDRAMLPYAVGLYITAAYWFTSSTSFANPAVTLARSLSATFAGIAPQSVPAFLLAQLLGGAIAIAVVKVVFDEPTADQPSARR